MRPVAPDYEAAIGAAGYGRRRRTNRPTRHARPRVLQLLATGGNGGAQESYTGLLLHLDRMRYDVRAISLSSGTAVQRLRRLGVAVDVIEGADAAAVRQLAAYLSREEIDLLHAHMFRAEVVGTRAARDAHTPVVVATVHSSRVRSRDDIAELAALTRDMDRLIVPSVSIERKVRAEGRNARFSVIPNGIDLDRFTSPARPGALRADLEIPKRAPLLGVVARLEPEKGHRYLVAAMPAILARHPDAHLAIVGEGSLTDALRAQIDALPGDLGHRVVLTGRRDDVIAVTAELDVAVLPSLREAQGISLLEAMALARPVVATAVGGIPEVITNGVDGVLVPPADPEALATAIGDLLDHPDRRRRMGEAGRRTVAERFSIRAMVRRVEAAYDEELVRAGVIASGERASTDEAVTGRPTLEVPSI